MFNYFFVLISFDPRCPCPAQPSPEVISEYNAVMVLATLLTLCLVTLGIPSPDDHHSFHAARTTMQCLSDGMMVVMAVMSLPRVPPLQVAEHGLQGAGRDLELVQAAVVLQQVVACRRTS